MAANKNKVNAAIRRLSKALGSCSELGLQLATMRRADVRVGDHVLHDGTLKRVVAANPGQPGQVAFKDGVILVLPDGDLLVLRS